MSAVIRHEHSIDWESVYALNAEVFETDAEAKLVETLRTQAEPVVSLVAELEGDIVGHILFSPVTLSGDPELKLMGLAPMAVSPEHQRNGIGSAMVHNGLVCCRLLGYKGVVVLGHPKYYPRFGFVPSSHYTIDSEYDVPEEVFMVLELEPGYLNGKTGRIIYHPAFADV